MNQATSTKKSKENEDIIKQKKKTKSFFLSNFLRKYTYQHRYPDMKLARATQSIPKSNSDRLKMCPNSSISVRQTAAYFPMNTTV